MVGGNKLMSGQRGGHDDAVSRVTVQISKGASTHSSFAIDRNFDQTFVQQARPPRTTVDQKFKSPLFA